MLRFLLSIRKCLAGGRRHLPHITAKSLTLDIVFNIRSTVSRAASAEEDTLCPLPSLHSNKEQEARNENYPPLPRDAFVPKDVVVDDGDIQDWEKSDESHKHSREKELVPPHVKDPLCKVAIRSRLHAEEASSHINQLPGQKDREPGEASEARCSCAEDAIAFDRIAVVAASGWDSSAVAVFEAIEDDDERSKTECCDPKAIDEHIDQDLPREDAAL